MKLGLGRDILNGNVAEEKKFITQTIIRAIVECGLIDFAVKGDVLEGVLDMEGDRLKERMDNYPKTLTRNGKTLLLNTAKFDYSEINDLINKTEQ